MINLRNVRTAIMRQARALVMYWTRKVAGWVNVRFRAAATSGLLQILVVCGIVGMAGQAMSQQPRAAAPLAPPTSVQPSQDDPTSAQQPVHPLDATDLESWLDGMIPAALEQGDIGGAVVSVVKDGKVLLAKGYGYGDVAAKAPMNGQRTLVRAGSVSKLFTWTAVMQLVEQGKIDLDADVNRYLDFKVPEPYGRPITINDLMMHRTGFEEGLKDVLVSDPKQLQPLGQLLKQHVRPVLYAPGTVPAYSNYGATLAGYIVERVSGEPFADYVAHHILTPLGMNHSTFAQPLPPALARQASNAYRSASEGPRPFELVAQTPAGALSVTAADMAQFMLAHLQEGRAGTGQILRPETMRLMHSPSIVLPNGFDTMAHGFFRGQRNGRLVLEHGGDTVLFHSDLEILPQEGVGIFVNFNSRGQGDATYGVRERLMQAFLDRYFPAPPLAEPRALPTAKAHGHDIAGRYETSRRVQSGFISLFYVLQGQDVVGINPDDTISLSSAPGKAFREVSPYVWREVGGTRLLQLTNVGGIKTIVDGHNPAGVLQAVPLKRNAGLNLPIFLFALFGLIAAAVAWLIAEAARRYYRQPSSLSGRPLLIRRLTRIATIADLLYLLAWFIILKPILSSDVVFYTGSLDPVIRLLQVAAIVPIAGAILGLWNMGLSLRSRRSRIIKAGSILVAFVLLATVWIAYVGGLMDFTLNY
ncbi:serine hydrolase domain-containing protein [Sphingomonas crusticola]|uniref:serine hydrolase domain-containing protein n=1 Tax=Sphingomonas crusticola TaxID=1697973 RepID=UPI0013C2EB5E|nr:serine hydrolase domain-containing protein [Sphingomonas crusticola]